MIVCSCNVVSDTMIRAALNSVRGELCPRTPGAVYKCLGCSPCCGRCYATVREIIDETLAAHAHANGHAYPPSRGGAACDERRAAHQTA